jgi:N-acetylneuraminic acid mutarotase
MAVRRMAHTLTPLDDGRVLAAGGWSDSSSPSASTGTLEVYDPAAGTWTMLPVQLARPRHDHAAVRLSDCRVIVVGGQQVEGSGAPDAPAEGELVVGAD